MKKGERKRINLIHNLHVYMYMYMYVHNKNEMEIEQPFSLVKSTTPAANVTASINWLRKVDLYSQGAYEPAVGALYCNSHV